MAKQSASTRGKKDRAGEASNATPTTRARSTGRKGNNKVPIELTLEREAEAWELHKQGYSQTEIARVLTEADPKHPIGQQAVSKALRRVQETLTADLTDRVDRYKVSQVGRLEGIYLLAMDSFRVSKGVQKKTKRQAAKGRLTVVQEGKTNDPGDPRWLEKAMDALRDMRKILGIDAPLKFDGTVKTERPLEDLTEEELLQEHAQAQARITEIRKRRGK